MRTDIWDICWLLKLCLSLGVLTVLDSSWLQFSQHFHKNIIWFLSIKYSNMSWLTYLVPSFWPHFKVLSDFGIASYLSDNSCWEIIQFFSYEYCIISQYGLSYMSGLMIKISVNYLNFLQFKAFFNIRYASGNMLD